MTLLTDKGRCDACKFGEQAPFDPNNIGAAGGVQCRRNPPTPLLVPMQGGAGIQGIWPILAPDAFCGEFKAEGPKAGDGIN